MSYSTLFDTFSIQQPRQQYSHHSLLAPTTQHPTPTAHHLSLPSPQFDTQCALLGVRVHVVKGDGNCMFRAIADQIEGDPNNHATVGKFERNNHAIQITTWRR